jgi:hypothetical protein
MLPKSLLTLLLCLLTLSFSYSQNIDYQEFGIDREEKKIYIPYTIKESLKYQNIYGIEVYYSQDKGETYKGPLQKVSGDVGKNITPGEKLIVWNYFEEDSTFNGQDVIFKLLVNYKPDPSFLGGPEKALYSVALSGWGDTKVWQKPRFWYLNTIATYGLIGSGLYLRYQSNQTREKYLQSGSSNEAQELFDKSNRQRIIGSSLLIGGVAVWLSDITRVVIKGIKNKREARKLRQSETEQIEKEKNNTSIRLKVEPFQSQMNVGLIIQF